MRINHLALLLLLSISSFSQETSKKFGSFVRSELELTVYEKDVDAKAVVLFDIGRSKFIEGSTGGYDIQFTRTRRIKILSDDFEESIISVEIPYYEDGYGKTEVIESLEAYTIHTDGGSPVPKKVLSSSIYDEKINNNWNVKKFIFPDVRKGDILEYKYVFVTPFLFNLPDWEFQSKIPTIHSEYQVGMIPFYEYVFIAQGISRFTHKSSVLGKEKRTWGSVNKVYGQNVSQGIEFKDYIHTYVLENVPAFYDESYITSINDYIKKIDFQLSKINQPQGGTRQIISTWPALIEGMEKNDSFGKFIKASSKYAKKAIASEIDFSSGKKAESVINYVKENFSWNGFNDKYASKSAKAFITQKEGNSAEINLYLIALLREAGIEADPVILSTRNHGKIKYDYPYTHFFNYVVVLVDNKFLTDGTEIKLPYNRLPVRCYNDKGLIVNDKGTNFIELKNQSTSFENITLTIDQIDSELLEGKVSVDHKSNAYTALALKNRFNDDLSRLSTYYSNKVTTANVTSSWNYADSKKPYILKVDGETTFESIGENIIVKPLLNYPIQENALKQKERSYPVDFIYPRSKSIESNIKIPESYTVKTLPEPLSISNDMVEISISYSNSEGMVTTNAKYYFKNAVYGASEYKRIKFYIDEIVKKFNREIVLEKI